jgi:hypothetical protein
VNLKSTPNNSFDTRLLLKRDFILGAAGAILLLGILYLLKVDRAFIFQSLIIFFFAAVILMKENLRRTLAIGVIFGLLFVLLAFYSIDIIPGFKEIREWDFLAFYIYGKAGASGIHLYDPAAFQQIEFNQGLPGTYSNYFNRCVFNVGFAYPPTTMLILAPIGSLDLQSANIVWRSLILVFLLLDVIIASNLFRIDHSGTMNLILVCTLFLLLPGSRTTIELSQTNFFMLFCVLMTYKYIDHWKSGIFLALAIIIKPIAVIWSLYFLITGRWKSLFAFAASGLILVLATITAFGLDDFISFFTNSPALRFPDFVYSEEINQSLNSVLLRFNMRMGDVLSKQGLFILTNGISLSLLILTILSSLRYRKIDHSLAFLIFFPLALVIYPGTLVHYTVILLPLIMMMILHYGYKQLIPLIICLLILPFSSFLSILSMLVFFIIAAFTDFFQPGCKSQTVSL